MSMTKPYPCNGVVALRFQTRRKRVFCPLEVDPKTIFLSFMYLFFKKKSRPLPILPDSIRGIYFL